MLNIFNYFSSTIDWCETNFFYNNYIVEFWNSISSLTITFAGIIGSLTYPESKKLFYTLIPIGLTSFYFHSTLSFLGQISDEFYILACIVYTVHFVNNNLHHFCDFYLLAFINFYQLLLLFTYPDYNRLILFIWGFLSWYFINKIKNNYGKNIKINFIVTESLFMISFFTWIVDYFFCVKFINFHSLWHLLIAATSFSLFRNIHFISTNKQKIKY